MRTLASFKDIHRDARIVVCGCGVSLNSLERPDRFITIGVNDVGRRFQPNYLVVVDPEPRFKGDRFHYVETSRAEYLFTQLPELGVAHPNIVLFRLGQKDGTDLSDPNVLHYSVITPYVAVCLAAHMGASRIGLIGVDFTDHHFFGDTGRHEWAPHVATIDEQFHRLGSALLKHGIRIFNLSRPSRLTAFAKVSADEFAACAPAEAVDDAPGPLRIASYATTPLVGAPAALARCINMQTRHYARCVWGGGRYGNGVAFDGDLDWNQAGVRAAAELSAADLVIVHNGKVDPRHRDLLAGKPVITMAHNYMANVDAGFVRQGFPGLVVGQYQATLPEFSDWQAVPNPIPFWEPAYWPAEKSEQVTICYTPSVKHGNYPRAHPLYWHSKGYDATMRILDRLATRLPLRLEVVREQQVTHAEAMAMKRSAHIVIDECSTGSYHRNSLEGLACGCVVVNGVGLLPGVPELLRHCAGAPVASPFVFADLDTLESVLEELIARGAAGLTAAGAANRAWVERHWGFAAQWDRFWKPAANAALAAAAAIAKALPKPMVPAIASPGIEARGVSVIVATLNEGEDLRRTIDCLSARLPEDGEIIVVDDGSTDGSTGFLRQGRAGIRLLATPQRLGSAQARNFGARHARGTLLVFCDAHVAVPPDWLGPLAAALGQPDVGAATPAIWGLRSDDDFARTDAPPAGWPRGYGLGWRDAALGVGWLGRKRAEAFPAPLLGAACLAMRRSVFAAVGGFDSSINLWGCEDAELSIRLWTLGFQCLVVPEVEVAHRFRAGPRPYPISWQAVLYNKLRLATLHFGPARIARVFAELRQNPAFPAAAEQLAASDAERRRGQIQSLRRYDDEWFFNRFRADLAPDLAYAPA